MGLKGFDRSAARWTVTVGVAVLVAACGTGGRTDQSAAPSSAAPSTVDVSKLAVGNYPTAPQPALGAAGTEGKGRVADARNLADYVVGPWDVDPTLVDGYATTAMVLKSADALSLIGPKAVAEAAGKQPFVNGFFSARQSKDKTILINAVVRYADDAAATAAAADMAQAALAEPTSGATRTAVPVPGHPDTLTSSYPFTDPAVGKEQSTVRALTAHGPFVLVQVAQSYNGLDASLGLIAKALDAQAPLIDQFKPTPPADFAGLPLDPTGLLTRTILVPPAQANVVQNWVYSPRGALHFQTDPIETAQLFATTGTDEVATGKTTAYQSKDAAAATTLDAAFVKQVTDSGGTPAEKVPGLPDSRCLKIMTGFYCAATADRYAIEAQSAQLPDAQQLAAAQYALLEAK